MATSQTMRDEVNQFYEFGPFRLNVRKRLLLRSGDLVPLAPKAIALLVALVENDGEVLSKDELMKRVWPNTIVEEANLSHHVFTLRKVLEDDKNGAKYIETIPRRGYRFVANVTAVKAESDDLIVAERTLSHIVIDEEHDASTVRQATPAKALAGASWLNKKTALLTLLSLAALIGLFGAVYFWRTSQPAAVGPAFALKSIAVLPFKPLAANDRDEALELGMAETLITRLSNLREVKVRPTSAVRRYADLQQDAVEAGRELQVASVLDASIQKSGDRLRVVARLLRVADGTTLWSDQFDEKFTDIFAVQDRIADRMALALALPLTGEERRLLAKRYTENVEAYRVYARGRFYWSKFTEEGLKKSVGLFEQAIEQDPTYALAYAGLCNAYMVLGVNGHMSPKEARPKAKYAAEKAIELDDRLAWAHQARGGYKLFHEWDWAGAEREFKRAMALDPSLVEPHELYSYLLSELGRFDEALAELRKAQELNPVAIQINSAYGDTLRQARRYAQAIAELEKTLEMDPNDFFVHHALGLACAQQGLYEKAVIELNKAVALSGNSTRMRSGLGQVYALARKNAEARKVIAELEEESKQRYVSPLYIALIYATLGDNDQAFAWLEKAFEDRACWLIELGIEPSWDKLRSDPRFKALLRRVGLPQ